MAKLKKRVFLITLPILLSLFLVSPALYALIWHLQHGNKIVFRGTEMQVPRGWVASPWEARNVNFIKFPVLVFGLRDSTSAFSLGQVPANASHDPEELYKSWVSVNWTLWNGSNGVVKGPSPFGTGEKEIVCMTSFPNAAIGRGMASCLLFQRTWMAQFTGNQKDVETFFEVVRGASTSTAEKHSTGKQ
jgi:hypothetical protein